MTQNVVNYLSLQETSRSNKEREKETNRHNLATEAQDISSLAETVRHNQASESIDISKLAETKRSNQANEAIKRDQNAEQARTNRVNEELRGIEAEAKRATAAVKQLEYALKDEIDHGNLNLSKEKVAKEIERMEQDIQASKTNQQLNWINSINNILDSFLDRSLPADDAFGKVLKYFK